MRGFACLKILQNLDIVHQRQGVEDIESSLIRYYKCITHEVLKSLLQTYVTIIDTILKSGICGVVEEVRSFEKVVL